MSSVPQENKYQDWGLVSYATSAGLELNGQPVPDRDDYPAGFKDYLPNIGEEGDDRYSLATLPGKDSLFEDALITYLGPAWDSRIAADIGSRPLQGDKYSVKNDDPKPSSIPGWNMTEFRIDRDENNLRTAYLNFTKAEDSVVAFWVWDPK